MNGKSIARVIDVKRLAAICVLLFVSGLPTAAGVLACLYKMPVCQMASACHPHLPKLQAASCCEGFATGQKALPIQQGRFALLAPTVVAMQFPVVVEESLAAAPSPIVDLISRPIIPLRI